VSDFKIDAAAKIRVRGYQNLLTDARHLRHLDCYFMKSPMRERCREVLENCLQMTQSSVPGRIAITIDY
jgi:hypothetical protein